MPQINGTTAPGWEGVRDAFAANWGSSEEVGAGVAVYHRGRKVVDLTGGWFDASREGAYGPETLQLVFSTTKGITAIAVAICAQRGLIDYDKPVAAYWPEFAASGKEAITVAQLLSHQAGLYSVDGPLTMADALDWSNITGRLAAQAPLFTPGAAHGYHAITYGWLAGELVRRVDPAHRSLGTFVAEEIVGPLGAELWIGLPEALEPRVAPILGALGAAAEAADVDPAVKAMVEMMMGPGTPGGRALFLEETFRGDNVFNRRDVHAAEIPAANGISNAASLARIYAATIGSVDGVRLVEAATIDRARVTVTPAGEPDTCLLAPTTFGMGFMTHGPFTLYAGPGCYGHPGAGGSVAFASPERELSFAYVMNQMAVNLAGDFRAQRLIDAAVACAG